MRVMCPSMPLICLYHPVHLMHLVCPFLHAAINDSNPKESLRMGLHLRKGMAREDELMLDHRIVNEEALISAGQGQVIPQLLLDTWGVHVEGLPASRASTGELY